MVDVSSSHEEIGRRVKLSLNGLTQASLAEQVGMKADAMSRALKGERGFSSVELVDIASVLGVDVYWLITGATDPMKVQIAARHEYDRAGRKHSNPGRSLDQQDLDGVTLAYRQAYPDPVEPKELPATAAEMRTALGADFARDFAQRVETAIGVDIIRLPRLTTSYSLTIGGHRAVVLSTEAKWFRSNSDLAHELGHLALGHHSAGLENSVYESQANSFAAELLLPEEVMRSVDWSAMTAADTARFVWDSGVSTTFIRNRLDSLGLRPSDDARSVLSRPMPGALRRFTADLGEDMVRRSGPIDVPVNPIDERMTVAAQRRFPPSLIAAHRKGVESGRLAPATLAWMLECSVESLFEDDDDVAASSPSKDDFSDFAL